MKLHNFVRQTGTEYVEEPVEYRSYVCTFCDDEGFSVHAELGLDEIRVEIVDHLRDCSEAPKSVREQVR